MSKRAARASYLDVAKQNRSQLQRTEEECVRVRVCLSVHVIESVCVCVLRGLVKICLNFGQMRRMSSHSRTRLYHRDTFFINTS